MLNLVAFCLPIKLPMFIFLSAGLEYLTSLFNKIRPVHGDVPLQNTLPGNVQVAPPNPVPPESLSTPNDLGVASVGPSHFGLQNRLVSWLKPEDILGFLLALSKDSTGT
ncbi:hypothetical protein NHQ30_009542 [Ciborinia camelliae]|nr:hypothetical protein NHQ30_009542 [Ciborinia camelliae]